jgi:hypothetical protein
VTFFQKVFEDHLFEFYTQGVTMNMLISDSSDLSASRFFTKKNFHCNAVRPLHPLDIDSISFIEGSLLDHLTEYKLQTLLDLIFVEDFNFDVSSVDFSQLIFNNLKPGGFFLSECLNSKSAPTKESLINTGFEILADYQNQEKYSIFCKKPFKNYFEASSNFHLYKHIFEKKKAATRRSYKHFDVFCQIINEFNINYFAEGGTDIGLHRHGGIIPWDDDIDLMFLEKDWENLLSIKPLLEENGLKFKRKGGWMKHVHTGKILPQDSRTECQHCHFGSIDCFKMISDGDYWTSVARGHLHKDDHKTVCKQPFGKTFINAPLCSITSLSRRYKQNYFSTGDVSDNFHFKDRSVPRFSLTPEDRSFFV